MGSLDKWREYFGRGESDIFGIIDHAIMVAAADSPIEFKSRRDRIAELLFSCRLTRCVGCDHVEVAVAAGEEAAVKTVVEKETVGGGGGGGGDKVDDDDDSVVDEVLRIKQVLFNKDDEPNDVLLDCLKKLESMSMSVEMLKDTQIGKAVNGLRKHSSEKIRKLANDLYLEWKELVDRWMDIPKETAVNKEEDWTPESANLSVVEQTEEGEGEEEEEEDDDDDDLYTFPSPPHDIDFYAHETNGFELSKIFDDLDVDGNLSLGEGLELEPEPERRQQSNVRRNLDRTNEGNGVGRYNNDKNQLRRREEADVRPVKHSVTNYDEPRRQPKQSREQMVPATQRKPLVAAEQKRKLAGPGRDVHKDMDPDAKFEFAKRKLQESYQQHEKEKKRRTIQVLETIPNQSKPKKPVFKKPVRR